MTRVGVIGASGIGAVHVRELTRAGAAIGGILGSSPDSSRATAERLSRSLGIQVPAFFDLDSLLGADLDGVVICTPAETHLGFLRAALGAGKAVLCEKPLFWPPTSVPEGLEEALASLRSIGAGRLAINTCNVHLLDRALALLDLPEKPEHFRFEFVTQGRHTGRGIGIDLLPHALSLLQRLDPGGSPSRHRYTAGNDSFESRFQFGSLDCQLSFRQRPCGEKRLAFSLDGVTVVRDAGTSGGKYRIRLFREDDPGRRVPVEDPFALVARNFVAGIETGSPFDFDDGFALENMRLLGALLGAGRPEETGF